MTLDTAFNELKAAYDKVAHEIELAHPALWARLYDWYGDDTEAKVLMLRMKPHPRFGDKSPLEAADEFGDDKVINFMDALDEGVCL